jgi:integrase
LRAVLKRYRLWANLQPDVKMLTVRTNVGEALTAEKEERLLSACRTRRSPSIHPIVTLALHTGMRRGEIQSLRWEQVEFLNRTVTVGDSKTESGQGRIIPLNDRALTTLQVWATNFAGRKPEHYVFPSEHYGLAGDNRKTHVKTLDATRPR